VIALAFTCGLILWLSPLAKAVGLVDVPNARKVHEGEIPLIGGLSIFIAVFAADVVSGFILPEGVMRVDYSGFYLAGMLLALVGMVDDFVDLSALHKIVVQTIATLIMVFGAQVVLHDIGVIGNDNNVLSLGIMAVPFTIFATIGVINAINMSDGLDGLAGSLSLVSILGLLAAASIFGSGEDLRLLVILAAAVVGFLLFNFRIPGRRSAVAFLGDSGSMFLGFTLAWFAIKFSQGENRIISPSAALWFMILPLFDAVSMTTRRIMKRRPAFGADKEHLHHIFLLAGFTVSETVGIMAGVAALGVGVGLAGTYFNVPDVIMGGSFLVLGLLYLRMIVHSWAVMRFLRHSICRRHSSADRRVIKDRRAGGNVTYLGPERRSGNDRRMDPRRDEDTQTHVVLTKTG
jgi:UDP-GlcNAc:undecaprenyl-phosphate GlcNAc-1-phosphate transferase